MEIHRKDFLMAIDDICFQEVDHVDNRAQPGR